MKKTDYFTLLCELASPIAMILVGVILVIAPDTATVLISRMLGWILTLVGIGFGIGAILNHSKAISRGITSVGLVCIGGYLSANPLLLAAFAGKLIGILILLRGIRDLFLARNQGYGQILAGIITAVGALLVLLPMTVSRLLFSGCGLVILVAGVWMLIQKIRNRQLPPGRPDIIDAL